MRAAILSKQGQPLELVDRAMPRAAPGQVVVRIAACAVCRTDLHVVDGDLPHPKHHVVPGHEIVGRITELGQGVQGFTVGDRVGIPWLGGSCGRCRYCRNNQENLCDEPKFTGYTIDGGFAEYTVANADYCFAIPERYGDVEAAPLLCAGLIGYRSLKMAGDAISNLGIYGFGAAAHIVAQIAHHRNIDVYAFTRPGDEPAQQFARDLGAMWVGGSDEKPPEELDAAILFAPVGALVPMALAAVRKGGKVVCGGIHMSPIPQFPYEILWGERCIQSVANLTRQDAREFLALAAEVPLKTTVRPFALGDVNVALNDLREGALTGAAVITP